MRIVRRFLLNISVVAAVLFLNINVCNAKQTIITIPSSDVLPGGEVILKQSNRFSTFGNGKYVSLTPQVTIGTGKDTEISIGAGTNIDSSETNVRLNLAAKKVFRLNRAARLTVGGEINPSLTAGEKPESMVFSHGSYLIRKTRTTVTSGVYVSGDQRLPNHTGVMLGIDQTIIPNKFRFVADWMSRGDSGCALAAGFKIRPEATTSITTAIIIPNNNEDRVAFSISISKYIGNILPEKKDKEQL